MTRWIAGCVALALTLAAGSAGAAEETPLGEPAPRRAEQACVPLQPGQPVVVDMNETPLADVARLVACACELDILFAPATLGDRRVTVVSARPIDRRGLLALWGALLASHDLVAERHGAYEVVRPARPAPQPAPSPRR